MPLIRQLFQSSLSAPSAHSPPSQYSQNEQNRILTTILFPAVRFPSKYPPFECCENMCQAKINPQRCWSVRSMPVDWMNPVCSNQLALKMFIDALQFTKQTFISDWFSLCFCLFFRRFPNFLLFWLAESNVRRSLFWF